MLAKQREAAAQALAAREAAVVEREKIRLQRLAEAEARAGLGQIEQAYL